MDSDCMFPYLTAFTATFSFVYECYFYAMMSINTVIVWPLELHNTFLSPVREKIQKHQQNLKM